MALVQFPGRLGDLREKMALASICPSHWTLVLESLERLFPGASVSLERIGIGAADVARYPRAVSDRAMWRIGRTPWEDHSLGGCSAGTIFRLKDVPETALASCRNRADGAKCGGAGIVLHRRATCIWALSVQVSEPPGDQYDPVISTLLRRLAPDLQRSFLISHSLGTSDQPDRAMIESSWDRLSIGVALLSADLRPLATNTAAEEVMSTRRFFAPLGRHGSLRAAVNHDNERLRLAVRRIVFGESDKETIALKGMRCAEPLPVTLCAVGRDGGTKRRPETGAPAEESLVATFGSRETEAGEPMPPRPLEMGRHRNPRPGQAHEAGASSSHMRRFSFAAREPSSSGGPPVSARPRPWISRPFPRGPG